MAAGNNHGMRWLFVAAFVLVACGGAPSEPAAPRDVAMPLPPLTLPLFAGGTWTSTSARGSALVIDVWASWCKPCGKAFPKLDALAARRSDIVIVAISIDEDPAAIRDFITKFPLAVPIVQDAEQVVTRSPLVIARLPTVLIVDRDQIIQHRLEEPSEDDYGHIEQLVDTVGSVPLKVEH